MSEHPVSDRVRRFLLDENLSLAKKVLAGARRAHSLIGSDATDQFLEACEVAHRVAHAATTSQPNPLEDAA